METRYYIALAVLLVWIAVRLGIILHRRRAQLEWRRQQEEEAQDDTAQQPASKSSDKRIG